MKVYIVCNGWDDHDCQPAIHSVFDNHEKAVSCAINGVNKDLEDAKEYYPQSEIRSPHDDRWEVHIMSRFGMLQSEVWDIKVYEVQ